MRGRRAFTLVELLVVIGIIAILLGILLPVIARARRVCGTNAMRALNLRQLVQGSIMYQIDYHVYPLGNYNSALESVFPNQVQVHLLDDLAKYLHYTMPTGIESVRDLPRVMVCPVRLDDEVYLDGPAPGPGEINWFTGYDYDGWLNETPNNLALTLKPTRVAKSTGTRRGVLWADSLACSTYYGPASWIYFHFKRGVHFNGICAGDTSALDGQNRAWSDGSVEWINGADIDSAPADFTTSASYEIGPPGGYYSFAWF